MAIVLPSGKTRGGIFLEIDCKEFESLCWIGYATDVEARRRQLSTTALPYEYEIYATYETSGNLEDKKLHKLFDNLNPDLRVSKNREFFIMDPEDAYELLETIALISDTKGKLKKTKVTPAAQQVVRKPQIDFFKCGLKVGDELVCTEEPSIVVTVQDAHKVLYNDQLTSLSAIMKEVKDCNNIAGPSYFTFNEELLTDIANRTQWKSNN